MQTSDTAAKIFAAQASVSSDWLPAVTFSL